MAAADPPTWMYEDERSRPKNRQDMRPPPQRRRQQKTSLTFSRGSNRRFEKTIFCRNFANPGNNASHVTDILCEALKTFGQQRVVVPSSRCLFLSVCHWKNQLLHFWWVPICLLSFALFSFIPILYGKMSSIKLHRQHSDWSIYL